MYPQLRSPADADEDRIREAGNPAGRIPSFHRFDDGYASVPGHGARTRSFSARRRKELLMTTKEKPKSILPLLLIGLAILGGMMFLVKLVNGL